MQKFDLNDDKYWDAIATLDEKTIAAIAEEVLRKAKNDKKYTQRRI